MVERRQRRTNLYEGENKMWLNGGRIVLTSGWSNMGQGEWNRSTSWGHKDRGTESMRYELVELREDEFGIGELTRGNQIILNLSLIWVITLIDDILPRLSQEPMDWSCGVEMSELLAG